MISTQRTFRTRPSSVRGVKWRTRWRRRNFQEKSWQEIEYSLEKFLVSIERKKAEKPKIEIKTILAPPKPKKEKDKDQGWELEKVSKKMQEKREKEKKEQEEAATKVQAISRGRKSRKQVKIAA